VEGISPADVAHGSEGLLHGADLTEYFGGADFKAADRVVISQLKYSTRSPNKKWTAARLTAAGSRGQASVIARLAQLYTAFADVESQDAVLAKLRIRLVSNQPCQPQLKATLAHVAASLNRAGASRNLKPLLDGLSESRRNEVVALHRASKLPPRRFVAFLRLLDLSQLGTGERWEQEVRIGEALGSQLIDGVDAGVNALYRLAQKHALPEQSDSFGLSAESVLAHLGTSRRVMFPVPSRVEVPPSPLITPDGQRLAELIAAHEESWVVAHGDAGVGKTTTVFTLEEHLPAGSVVVAYDCFGGGQSIGSLRNMTGAQTRHSPKDALMQIVNELALRCGTPFMLSPSIEMSPMWRHLDDALRVAGQSVGATGGRLVIAVDAVDNAVIAARRREERSFIPDLLRVEPPEGVTFLVSARTHRLDQLSIPQNAFDLELEGFDEPASAKNLRGRFPDADDETVERFHERSDGNPRSQFYLLAKSRENPVSNAAEAADQAFSSPKTYFQDLLNAAVEHVPKPDKARDHLSLLISLPRPAEISDLASVSGLSASAGEVFCRGLVPGLHLSGGRVEFRDEDFETFLEDQVDQKRVVAAHGQIADYFLSKKNKDPEAAIQVARHLLLSDRGPDLIDLCLQDGPPTVIEDPVSRIQAFFSRLELAMRVAESPAHRSNVVRLLVLAAQAARTDKAVESIVRRRPDLAIRFGEREPVERIYEDAASEPWQGPVHLKLAALSAESGDKESARDHFRLGEAWVQRWLSSDKARRRTWDLEADDLAAGAQAICLVAGFPNAMEWVLQWGPPGFRSELVGALFKRLATSCSPRKLTNDLAASDLDSVLEARALTALFTSGRSVSSTRARIVAEALVASEVDADRTPEDSDHWQTDFTELVARTTGDRSLIRQLLTNFGPDIPQLPPFRHHLNEWDPVLRSYGLRVTVEDRESDLEDLLPDQLKQDVPTPDDYHDREELEGSRRRYRETVGRALPAYCLRARALLRRPRIGSVSDRIDSALAAYLDPVDRRWYEPDFTYERWARLTCETIAFCRDDGSRTISSIVDAAEKVVPATTMETRLVIGQTIVDRDRYRGLALSILDSVAQASRKSDEPAAEKSERLLTLSGIVATHDPSLGGDYYRSAVEAAEGLDDDGALLLTLEAYIGELTKGSVHPAKAKLGGTLARAIDEYRPFVTDVERLPWTRIASTAAILNAPAGLALLARWDGEGHLPLAESVPRVVPSIVEGGFLSSEVGVSLLRLAGEEADISAAAIRILEISRVRGAPGRSELGKAIRALSQFICRDLLPDARLRVAPPIDRWLRAAGLSGLAGAAELSELAAFADSFHQEPSEEASPYATPNESAAVLEKGADDKAADLASRLGELCEHFVPREEIERYLRGVGSRLAPGERRQALQSLADLPADGEVWRQETEVLIKVIHDWLVEWSDSSAVRAWADEHLVRLLEDRALLLLSYEEVADRTLPTVVTMPMVDDPGALLIRALGPRLNELRPEQLYGLARGLASTQAVDDLVSALEWCLDLHQEESGCVPEDLPQESAPCLGLMFWALFGHPDRRVRWRAAYAAREALVLSSVPGLAVALEETLHTRAAGQFAPSTPEFFWLSAQLWGYMTFARVAGDKPAALRGLASKFAARTMDEEWPHAAIREFARRAALRIESAEPGSLEATLRQSLEESNRARAWRRERGDIGSRGNSRDPGDNRRFNFDAMDTLPYWYEPLATLFATSTQCVVREAEHWIVDQLFATDDLVELTEKSQRGHLRYEEMANNHGSIPRYENFGTYLEFHAMLLAAGKWIGESEKAVVADRWTEEDPWLYWLARYLDGSELHWGADLRSPAPLRPDSYGNLGPAKQWREREQDEYDLELGENNDLAVAYAHREFSSEDRYGSASISSALVSPKSASALMSALQTCEDSRLFQLPTSDAGWRSDAEINQHGFRLLGWLTERHLPDSGMTEHDPLSRNQTSSIEPGGDFLTNLGLRSSSSSQWLSPNGEKIAWLVRWSDEPPDPGRGRREYRSYSSGVQLFVRLPELLHFMQSQEMDLIVDVTLARQYRETARDSNEEERYESGNSRVYIMRRSGELESLARGG
jgi:hypothetical protein